MLSAATVRARHLAVSGGQPDDASINAAISAVDAVDKADGAELGVSQAWSAARADLAAAANSGAGQTAYDAYGNAATALLDLVVAVSDASNLTLDPDLDSYYVMDTLVFRLPGLLDQAGRTVDETLLASGRSAAVARTTQLRLARAAGALASTQQAIDSGVTTALAETARRQLADVRPLIEAEHQAVAVLLSQVDGAVASGQLANVTPAAGDEVWTTVVQLTEGLVPQLDALLTTRIAGFQAKAYVVEAAAAGALLLVGYLLVGFYRSATVPLSHLTAVSAGAEEMAASISEISQGASQAAAVATEAVDAARNTEQTIGRLGTSSAQIGEVLKVITGIAAQTTCSLSTRPSRRHVRGKPARASLSSRARSRNWRRRPARPPRTSGSASTPSRPMRWTPSPQSSRSATSSPGSTKSSPQSPPPSRSNRPPPQR